MSGCGLSAGHTQSCSMESTTEGAVAPEKAGETSKAGLRRMQRLAVDPPTLHDCQTMAFHPTTSALIYHSPSPPAPGFVMTPILHPHAPRPIPFPPMLSPPSQISTSPDGQWITAFHPNIVGQGGNLAIYSKAILSPLMDQANATSQMQANLPLDKTPLQILPLYPPRVHTAKGKAPQIGPVPPPRHRSEHGPVFLVLTSSALLLVHPHPQLTVNRNAAFGIPSRDPTYTSTVLRAPLNMRWRAVLGDQVPIDSGYAVERGWMGMVAGNDAAWIALEKDGEVGLLRAEVGIDRSDRWYLATTPLPPLNLEGGIFSSPSLQGVCFTRLPSQSASSEPQRGVAAVIIQSLSAVDSSRHATTQTRIISFSIQLQKAELVDSFTELSGQSGTLPSWDWFVSATPVSDSTSPSGFCIEALQPLPSVEPYTLVLALISTAEGLSLTHLDLVTVSEPSEEKWRNVVGEQAKLGSWQGSTFSVSLSQGAQRGMLGLVAVNDGTRTVLVPSPAIQVPDGPEPIKSIPETAHRVVARAIRDGFDWADVIRAALTPFSKPTAKGLAEEVLFAALSNRHIENEKEHVGIDDNSELLRLEIALLSASNQTSLRDVCAEMLQLRQASSLLASAARFDANDTVSFDIKCVWPLVSVAEWAFTRIAAIFRDVILARAAPAKTDSPLDAQTARALHLLVPDARNTLLLLLSQLRAFSKFVARLDEPIPQPETRYMPLGLSGDSRATVLAKDRMASVAEGVGVDVEVWGKELQVIDQAVQADVASNEKQNILLHPENIHSQILSTLSSLPAPSWLFIQESDPQTYDTITFQPIPDNIGVRCDRCEGRTVSLFGALAPVATGTEPSAWERWVREREEGCGCGGCWVRGK